MQLFNCLDPKTPLQGHHLLEASAGTGKTFAIEHLVVRLLIQNTALDQILVVTFMRAAARELKVRIRQAIAHAIAVLRGDEPAEFGYLTALLEEKEATVASALLQLEQAYVTTDQMQVFTIHGFCARMLSDYPFEARVHLALNQERRRESKNPVLEAIHDFLRTSLRPDLFSSAQITALFQKYQYDVKRLTAKILTLIEMKSAFSPYPDFTESYHRFCQKIKQCPPITVDNLREVAPFFTKICNRAGQVKLAFCAQVALLKPQCTAQEFDILLTEKQHVLQFLDPAYQKKRAKGKLPPKAADFFLVKEKIWPIIVAAQSPIHTLMRIAEKCQHKLAMLPLKTQQFSPDDLLNQMQQSLSFPAFLKRVQTRYNAAIIDEFQDTDPVQWDIFKRLFVDQPVETLYLVGDPKQSIYSFRDADINAYFAAAKLINQKSYLTTNYRSDPKLLQMLNTLFRYNPDWLSLPGFPLDCPPVDSPISAIDTSFPDDKSPLHFLVSHCFDDLETLEKEALFPFIAAEIDFLNQEAAIPLDQIALLVRDRYQANRLKVYLESCNVPVLAKEVEPIAKTASYTLWQTLLRAVRDPADKSAMNTFLAHSLFPMTHDELRSDAKIAPIHAIIHDLHQIFHQKGLPKMVASLLERKWLCGKQFETLLVEQEKLEAISDFRQIATLLVEYGFQTRSSLAGLLRYLSTLAEKSREKSTIMRQPIADVEAVSIMTIHMSKGLEFAVVFALGTLSSYRGQEEVLRSQKKWRAFDRKDPVCRQILLQRQAENLRQLYVALTRAKQRLYVPVACDPTKIPVADDRSSSLELFLSKLPPLSEVITKLKATVTTLETSSLPTQPLRNARDKYALLPPPQFRAAIKPHPLASFSSLSRAAHQPLEKISEPSQLTQPIEEPVTNDEAILPKGAKTGVIIHALFEQVIREQWLHRGSLKESVEQFLKKTALAPWTVEIETMVRAAFTVPLLDFSLSEVLPTDLYPEVEFFFSRKHELIKGFIDLIFCHRNVYYLIDWKTNFLDDYSPAGLAAAMDCGDYLLQAKLYFEALRRYLTHMSRQTLESRKADKHTLRESLVDEKYGSTRAPYQIGGVFYLFLRGLAQKKGVYFVSSSTLEA